MNYTAVGIMSGSSMDGLDIACVRFEKHLRKWTFQVVASETKALSAGWLNRLSSATLLPAKEYLILHTEFGAYCGRQAAAFLKAHKIKKADCIGFHGHTTFHLPAKGMTHQLGDGAALSVAAGVPTVTDLRSADIALGGQGAPIVPIGEKYLFPGFKYFLNIGGIANISHHEGKIITAFDVCPANRVLNMLAGLEGKKYDQDGKMASHGEINVDLLRKLNALKYYKKPHPKSLANDYGTDVVYPLIMQDESNLNNALATYTEHIAQQVSAAVKKYNVSHRNKMLITGGGAFNKFLISRLRFYLENEGQTAVIPEEHVVSFKEAIVMAFIAVLRMCGEHNVLASVTGAVRDSCNGALWAGK